VTRSRALARPTRAATAVVTLALTGALGLAGCAEQPQRAADEPAPTRATAVTPSSPTTPETRASSATPSPTATTTSAAPTATSAPTPSSAPTGALTARLLSADELPGFNEQYHWVAGGTRTREGRALFGTCQRFATTSIGATSVAVRDYRPAKPAQGDAPDPAGELVAEFPDSTTAQRAFAVLKAWRRQCADRLPGKDPHVGELQSVQADGGTGGWYLLTYRPPGTSPDEALFDAQGLVVVGNRIAMLKLRNVGQDYDYEAGHEPMVAAVQRAAGKLG
jgi:hypothetical protein